MKIIPLLFSILISVGFASAQTTTDLVQEIDVIKVYEKVVEEGYYSPQIYEKLATSYYVKENFPNAIKWFDKLLETITTADPSIYLYYAKSLEAMEKHEKARKYRNIYQNLTER